MNFTSPLLNWYDAHSRNLPWREQKDPYKIWLSEINDSPQALTKISQNVDRLRS